VLLEAQATAAGGAAAGAVARVHCALGCGREFHLRCMSRWLETRGGHARRECPACRAPWHEDARCDAPPAAADAAVGEAAAEGYLNLSSLQPGTSAARDTSSYSSWLEVHERRREQQDLNRAGCGAGSIT